ncbi:MAG: hypothetical protein ACRELB_23270, partial [Polyangiaceae bacterium]
GDPLPHLDASADGLHPGDADAGPHDASAEEAPETSPPPTDAGHALPIIPNNGGPVLSSPLLVTITYADDANRAFEEALGAFMPTSSWLSGAGKEYGVGPGTSAKVELTENAPITIDDSAIQTKILGLISDGTAPDPLADAGAAAGTFSQAAYVFYVPATTNVTVVGSTLCQISSGGYHYESSATVNGHTIAYAVVSECAQGLPVQPPQDLAWAASHEFIETCTDPYPLSAPGYVILDPNEPWSAIGGEVGDLCTYVFPQASEGGYTLQRVYSDAAVAAGGDPCLPSTVPYFAAAVSPEQFVPVSAGQSTTFTLTGWATGSVPPWSLSAYPYVVQGGGSSPSLVLGTNMLSAGQTTTLKVSVAAGTPSNTVVDLYVTSQSGNVDYTTAIAGIYVP